MTLLQSLEEAKVLKDYLKNIYNVIYHMPKFNESEVRLRAETLRGFILVFQNDVFGLTEEWEKELDSNLPRPGERS